MTRVAGALLIRANRQGTEVFALLAFVQFLMWNTLLNVPVLARRLTLRLMKPRFSIGMSNLKAVLLMPRPAVIAGILTENPQQFRRPFRC